MALINKCQQRLHSKEGRPNRSRIIGAEEKWAGTIDIKVSYSAKWERKHTLKVTPCKSPPPLPGLQPQAPPTYILKCPEVVFFF